MMEFKEITGLIVKPGDRVIVTLDRNMDNDEVIELGKMLHDFAPDVRWAFANSEVGFTVVRDDKPKVHAQVACEQTKAHESHEWLDTRGEDASAIVRCPGVVRPEGCPATHAHGPHVLSTVQHGIVRCPGVA